MPSSSLPCDQLSTALGPMGASSPIMALRRPSLPRPHRPRRVLYPAFQSRRPPLKEAPDQARRWLLLLSTLVFLQIYTEDTHSCTELQNQCPDPMTCLPSEGDQLCTAHNTREEPWMLEVVVSGASEHQMECVVV